jgi:hypothetical protein
MTPSSAHVIMRHNAGQNLWRFVASDTLLAVTAIGLVSLLAATVWLPQAPHDDSIAYARWLSDTQLRFGSAAGVLSALGLFDIVHSIVFRAVAAALGLALTARLIDRAQDLRDAARLAPPPDPAPYSIEIKGSPAEIARRWRRYHIRQADTFSLADRFPWAHAGSIAAHVGPLVMLIGLALSPALDWRVDAVNAIPGSPAAIAGTPYTLDVSAIDARQRVSLALRQDGAPIVQGVAAPGQPVIDSRASVFVRELLPALRVTGRNASGEPLKLQSSAQSEATGELLLTFNADRRDGFFAAPEAGLAVRVSLAGALDRAEYEVAVFDTASAGLIAEKTALTGGSVEAAGSRFEFERESHAVVAVARAPMQVVVVAGLGITLIGLACVAFYPVRRVWLVAGEVGTRVVCDDAEADLAKLFGAGHEQ